LLIATFWLNKILAGPELVILWLVVFSFLLWAPLFDPWSAIFYFKIGENHSRINFRIFQPTNFFGELFNLLIFNKNINIIGN